MMAAKGALRDMANINPEEVSALAKQLLSDSAQLDDLARTMPSKIQRMEDGARGLHAAAATSDTLNEVMSALQAVAKRLDSQRAYLHSVISQMDDLIRM